MSTEEEASQKWLMVAKFWLCYKSTRRPRRYKHDSNDQGFTDHSEEDEIYPLTDKEIVESQKAATKLKDFFVCNATLEIKDYSFNNFLRMEHAYATREG